MAVDSSGLEKPGAGSKPPVDEASLICMAGLINQLNIGSGSVYTRSKQPKESTNSVRKKSNQFHEKNPTRLAICNCRSRTDLIG